MAFGDHEVKVIRRFGQSITVIAQEGSNHDWAAYAESDRSRAEGNTPVALHDFGSKLSPQEGASAFRNWEEGDLHWRL